MKYMGSKNRIAKYILPIILKDRKENQWYVEPFCGGCNLIDKVDGNRIANDNNVYLIEMFKAIVYDNWNPPDIVSHSLYNDVKKFKEYKYDKKLIGWVGFNCSYCGKFFGGYSGKTKTKMGIRDYQLEARNNILKQIPNLKNVAFKSSDYLYLKIPENSIIYCDIPYENTTKYKEDFNHKIFWDWCRNKYVDGHKIFVSEYNAPSDFVCLWEKEVKSSLSSNGKSGGNKNSVEDYLL